MTDEMIETSVRLDPRNPAVDAVIRASITAGDQSSPAQVIADAIMATMILAEALEVSIDSFPQMVDAGRGNAAKAAKKMFVTS